MEKIHISFMKDLRNNEFGELFDIISTIVVTEKIELLPLTIACERLNPHSQELLKMNSQKLKHPLTKLIRDQVNTRTEFLSCLRMTVDAKMMWHKSEQRVAAARLQLWLRTYKADIFAPTITTQSALVENLMADWIEDASIKEATALLDLDGLLAEIVKITANIRRNQLVRLNEKDIYEVDGQAKRGAAYKDLKVLISVIDSSYNIGASEEQRIQLVTLSKNLNAALQEFHTILKSRNTKRKNKKETVAAVSELIDTKLKVGCLESETNNLPIAVHDELKTLSTHGTYASYTSLYTDNGATPALGNDAKDAKDNRKFNSKNGTENSFRLKKDMGKGPEDRDKGLRRINNN